MTTRQMNQNDGVVLYVKTSLKHKVQEIQLVNASCLRLDILSNIVYCIYRSPSISNTDGFIDSLSKQLNTVTSQKNIIIAGDININIKPKESESSQEHKNRVNYLNMLSFFGILTGHTLPTREQNCLDHFMIKINKIKFSAFIAILHTTVTDHYTTFICIKKAKNDQIVNKTSTTLNFEQALKDLQENNLSELLFCNDPNLLINNFINIITNIINENTNIKKIPSSQRIIKPWITPGILRCIQNRNRLQKQTCKDPHNKIIKITYNRYRNFCNRLIKRLKRKYERNLLAQSVSNNKLLWKNIKTITYSNKLKSQHIELLNIKATPKESINHVNNYFANIGKQLAQKINSGINNVAHNQKNTIRSQLNTFVLLDTDDAEVERILMNLKSDSAPGWDSISTKFLKFIRNEAVPIITHLANLCLQKGVFPAPLKQSVITPVYKGGDKDDVNNYRPISVLPSISKVLEKIINTRLTNYLTKFNILSNSQFGFRKDVSTEDAVTALSSLVAEHLDKGKKCLSVFLDLKKAFDTVSVPILVNKLEKVGIRGIALSLFTDYLSNRKQRVKIGQYTSDDVDVSYGVPQGSVLGPTLFLLYINDLCNMEIKNAKVFSYADDTSIVFSGSSWPEVKLSAEAGMARVAVWLEDNLLSLNTNKTNYICFSISNKTQPTEELDLKVHTCENVTLSSCNCSLIERVTETKYLGVMLDQALSWYPQLEQTSARIRKLSWIFKTLRHIVPTKMVNYKNRPRNLLNEIYVALAQSVLLYCIPIWGGAAKTKIINVERAQRSLIKIMYFKNKRFSTESLYQISGLLSVRKLYITQIALKIHKTLPYHRNQKIKRRIDLVAQVPQTKTKFASRQFNKRSAQLYNKINRHVYIHNKNFRDCKKSIVDWIQPLTYEETEELLEHVG
ncbi:hypothetical protein PYW07_013231 [Mythimna separata]|uniref:Reverse transcriptase domain-containing protein n=1 Tax=Mythimna separata TaxID=271217 RepID=A0AAD7Y5W3_MYTSE|nr:hypothetical protein PYW07_013231 [Mythimna separata]